MDYEKCAAEIYEKLFDGERGPLKHLECFTIESVIRDHAQEQTGFTFKPRQEISRRGDMSREDRLELIKEDDGDIILTIYQPTEDSTYKSVEFCSCGSGGGKSPRTRRALEALAFAIAMDNKEDAARKGPRDQSGVCFE